MIKFNSHVLLGKLGLIIGLTGTTAVAGVGQDLPVPDPRAVSVPKGYQVEVILQGLSFPTSLVFDDDGRMIYAEAGIPHDHGVAAARIVRLEANGTRTILADDELQAPVNDLLWHDGALYVSHRGKISRLTDKTGLVDLVTDLPSHGDHHNNQLTVGADGRLYFGQGTATNSGVVGLDNYAMGWLERRPDVHELSPYPVRLAGQEFLTADPLTAPEEDQAATSAFHPFGAAATFGEEVEGHVKGNGTILTVGLDGSDLRVHAWGLRNPFGLVFNPIDGRLYATENGFDERGSRPIANDWEDLYVIEEGAFYGWPDFASGLPVSDQRFHPQNHPPAEFLLLEHPPVEMPLTKFPEHSAIAKLDVSRSSHFGHRGHLFIAFFGHMTPMTGEIDGEHFGHRVVRVDPRSGAQETFFIGLHEQANKMRATESHHAGPRRPIDVQFSQSGESLYVVDFGFMTVDEAGKHPIPESVVIWRVSKRGH